MNQEKQRIAIAAACGGTYKPCACGHCGGEFDHWHWPDGTITDEVPDYLNSLDDMHEAEERMGALEPGARRRYAELLRDWLGADGSVFATAAQRAEALLKTLSLWSD